MRKLARYFLVVIAISIVFMANTVTVAFTLTPSKETQNTLHPNESSSGLHSSSEKTPNENRFLDFWGLENFTKNTPLNGTKVYDDFAVDTDSMQLIIGVNKTLPNAYNSLVDEVKENGGRVVNTVSVLGEAIAVVADVHLDTISSLVTSVKASRSARYVEPNMKMQAQLVPNDPYWSSQWGPMKIEADWAWNTTTGAPSILVAIVDTGVDYTHADLDGNYVALGYDWVNNDTYPMDDHGHGTHCAGIVAAELNNNLGIAGLAQVKVMAEKVLTSEGWGYWEWVANGIIDAADAGADIISMSLGGPSDSQLVHDAVKYAYDAGVLIVAAAGNDNSNMKSYPAAYEEVIAVAATDQNDNKASFSNWGEWIELAAPGVSIYSTVPWGYESWSGTSMACPHVSGVAALAWVQHPNKTRDWIRMWLRYTADDLGDAGFDVHYGYGRINARKAVEESPPAHELIVSMWQTPPYVEPSATGIINATILNFGENNETDVTVQLLANDTVVDSTSVGSIISGEEATASLYWSPVLEGLYNVTLYVVPVANETSEENNVVQKGIYVGFPSKVFVLHSAGNSYEEIITNWQVLNSEWYYFGDTMIYIDYTTLNKEDITYEDIAATEADVLIISCAYDSYAGWEFTDSEIEAIEQYVHEGHGLIVTAGTFYYNVPNNNKLAPLFGLNETIMWDATWTDLLHLLNTTHPLFRDVPDPFVFTTVGTALPSDWQWDSNELIEGEYLALGHYEESAIVAYRGLVYISPWLEVLPAYYRHHVQVLYNAITWSRYQKPQHEIAVSLEAPKRLLPGQSALLNATVSNTGLGNETNVELYLLINNEIVENATIPELANGTSYTLSYTWSPSVGMYNVTVYAPPVLDEDNVLNNVKTELVSVQNPLINPIEGQYANYILGYYDTSGNQYGPEGYLNFSYDHYVEPFKINITVWAFDPSGYVSRGWMIVNTMNRLVEEGWVWEGMWYLGWIETNIGIGSTINLWYSNATVNGTRMVVVGPRVIDCWEIPYSLHGFLYTFWYDKVSGLWVGMEAVDSLGNRMKLLLADTNVPIGTQYEHDLGVTLETQRYLRPGEASLIKATVHNLGLHNETGVQLQLFINSTLVATITVTEFINGTSQTMEYSWAPTTRGVYNVTAYSPPVSGEDVTLNNVARKIVYVRYVEVALISDSRELMAITTILDSIEIGYDIYNDNTMHLYTQNLSLLLGYKGVILYKGYRYITYNESSTLESYLSSGGNLLVTGYDCIVNDMLMADLLRSFSTGDNVGEYELIVFNDAHPIMNGPYGSFPAGYYVYGLYGDCDRAEADTTRNAVTVAELSDGYDRIIATEGLPGKVVFWNGVGTYDWSWSNDCQAMFKNLIHWFVVRYEHDLACSLEAPRFLEPGDSTLLNATVQNQGLNNETNVELQLLINGTIMRRVTFTELRSGDSSTMSYAWTPALAAAYNVTVYSPPVSGENNTGNNAHSRIVRVQYAPRILAYVQYTDYYNDYPNTLRALEQSLGSNYVLTELWSYNELPSMIPGKDILLIPDQEYSSLSTMQAIGATWSETLDDFLENGGIIILCDGGFGNGLTYGILAGAQLMSISSSNYRSYYTLYLVDTSDPLAEGVSSSFVGPYFTVSFVTSETNVVISDGTYPVVVHKEKNRGHIVLLGFDFEYYNDNTQKLLGNAAKLAAYFTVSISPSAGSPGTRVAVSGTKATANGTVSLHWDDTFVGNTTADNIGDFTYLLTVPEDATVGVHEIKAVDTATGKTASAVFRVILVILNPSRGPAGTKVILNGVGFSPESQVTVTFNDMLIGYAMVDTLGNLTFTFNVPVSSAEQHTIRVIDAEGNSARATFTVVDVTPLDVQIDVGTIHFVGEVVEFYTQTVFKGKAVNATATSAVLYKPDGTTETLTVQLIATGLYKISYTILGNETGTYTLVITASYVTDTAEADGTALRSFLVSGTLALMSKQVIEIKDGVALIQTDLGFVRLNLTAMNATLENIFLSVIAINGTTATIQTTIGVVNGTITSMQGDLATILVPGVGQIQTDVSSLRGAQESWTIPQYVTFVLAFIAAASSTLLLFLLRRRRTI